MLGSEELRASQQKLQSPAAKSLAAFLREPASSGCITGKADERTTVIDQGARITYAFPPAELAALHERLEAGRLENIVAHFSERQGTAQAPSCGIHLDWDLVVAAPETDVTERDLHRIAIRVVAYLRRDLLWPAGALQRGEARVHVFSTKKAAPAPCAPGKWKYGFHLLLPGVLVSRGYKKHLIRELQGDAAICGVLAGLGPEAPPGDCLDPASATVPVLYLGSCKRGGRAYALGPSFEVSFDASEVGSAGAPPPPDSAFCPMVRALRPEELRPYNLVAELALCSQARGPGGGAPLVAGHLCECRPELASSIEDLAARARDSVLAPGELLLAEHALSTLAVHDPEARFLHQVLDLLDESYASEREKWRNVVYALANTSESYRPLAEWFSQKCPAKWADGGRLALDDLWNDAIARRGSVQTPLTRRSLLSWAQDCNPERFRQISEQGYFALLTRYVYDYAGTLEHFMVARVLHAMLGTKFVTDVEEGARGRAPHVWYEFVVAGQPCLHGEVWKWRRETEPDELQIYISESLSKVFDRVAEHLEKERSGAQEEGRAAYYKALGTAFAGSRRKIFNDAFKGGVIRQAQALFRRRGFIAELDQDPLLLGVANGVLRLGQTCELIARFHEHPVLSFTPVTFRAFDPADPWTRLMLDAVADIIPEADFRDWLLFFAASSLSGGVKEGLLLLWNGGGANGKTFFMRMVAKTLGSHYARKLNISLLTSERESADRPNSAVMQLKGCRWGYVEETQKAEALNSQRLKEIVNPGEISGRELNCRQENFEITANIAVGQNYDFHIDCNDHGTWRRLRHYKSRVKFCSHPDPFNPFEKKDDQRFVREYIADPLCQSAFLSILVHYYSRLQREYGGELKRVECPTLERGTQLFRNSQDTLHRFITEKLVLSPGLGVEYTLTQVATCYSEWYEANIGRGKQVVSELIQDLENSMLQKYLRRAPNRILVLAGCRFLTDENRELGPDEAYLGIGAPLGELARAPDAALAPPRAAWWLPAPEAAPGAAFPEETLSSRKGGGSEADFVFIDDAQVPEPGVLRRRAAQAERAEAAAAAASEPPLALLVADGDAGPASIARLFPCGLGAELPAPCDRAGPADGYDSPEGLDPPDEFSDAVSGAFSADELDL